MADEQALIPVFIPPLAWVLADAERTKGSPLAKAEVESIRDRSACIMMERRDAERMPESRGYIDVNPENCWADWPRLRVQMTGKGYLPKIVLCFPGGKDLRGRCEPILKAEKVEYEFRPHDSRLVQAFKASSITWPSFAPEDFARIDEHTTVLYALSANFVAAAAPTIGREFLNLGRRLLEAGGTAIKCESSGISHPATRWSALDKTAEHGADEKWFALFRAYVVYPIGSETEVYSCGMHLLGAPDLITSEPTIRNSIKAGESFASAAARLFRSFGMYLLSECAVGKFASGHTFSTDRDSPRYRLLWEPCTGYAEDDFFFNPFGRWRFTTP